MDLQRGMRDKLEKYIDVNSNFDVKMEVDGSDKYSFFCFGVDNSNKISDENYAIFSKRTLSPENEIKYSCSGNTAEYNINLSALPASVNKLVFAVVVDGVSVMGNIRSHVLSIYQNAENKLNFPIDGTDFKMEKAVITAEIYKKDVWRISAVAMGFNDGLKDLLKSYGKDSINLSPEPPQPVVEEEPVAEPIPPQPVVEEKPVAEPIPPQPVVEENPVAEPIPPQPIVEEKPVAEPIIEPIVEEKPVAEPIPPQPVVEEEPVAEPIPPQPIVEEAPVAEPIPQPIVEEEPVAEPITEPIVEESFVAEPVAPPPPPKPQFANPFAKLSSKPQSDTPVTAPVTPAPQNNIIDDDDDEPIIQQEPQPKPQFVNPFAKLSSKAQNTAPVPPQPQPTVPPAPQPAVAPVPQPTVPPQPQPQKSKFVNPFAKLSGKSQNTQPVPPPPPQPMPQPTVTPTPQPAVTINPQSTVTIKPAQPQQPQQINLQKGQTVSIVKSGDYVCGEISINLNWKQPTGFMAKPIDLDLGCLYELNDGSKGTIQALGKKFGSLEQSPFIYLDSDDRSGASSGGETLRINARMISQIKRILVYAFIYEGSANWRGTDGVVTVKCAGSPEVIVKMDEYGSDLTLCAVALLENNNNDFTVKKIVDFYKNQVYADNAFNWGLKWKAGKKD